MGHDHAHGHGHARGHAQSYGRAFAAGIALNLGFVAIEATYGVLSRSMALVADAGHNLRFHIGHSTLQLEPPEAPDPCRLAPDEIV